MPDYQRYIQLAKSLQGEAAIASSVKLWDVDIDQLYASVLNRLAQPLPTGEESPFSNMSPGTAHEVLTSALIWIASLQANEFNYIPDYTLLQWMSIWGVSVRQAEYPIVNITFYRSQSALVHNIDAEVPQGLDVTSSKDSTLTATVITEGRITGADASITLPARVNRPGRIEVVQNGEFSILPSLLSGVDRCENVSIISPGAREETPYEAVLRMRDQLQIANRGVSDYDVYRLAMAVSGVTKINVIRGVSPGVSGVFRDLRTVVVYPPSVTDLVRTSLLEPSIGMVGDRWEFYPAEVVPIDGSIQVYGQSNLYQYEIYNLAVGAIQSSVNPPAGNWGDTSFISTLGNALEQVNGIFGIGTVSLQNAVTGVPLDQLTIEPWQLLEIQSTTQIEVLR